MASTKPREMGPTEMAWMSRSGHDISQRMRETLQVIDTDNAERDKLIGLRERTVESMGHQVQRNTKRVGPLQDQHDEDGGHQNLMKAIGGLLESCSNECAQPDAPDAAEQLETCRACDGSGFQTAELLAIVECHGVKSTAPCPACNPNGDLDPAPPEPEVAKLVETVEYYETVNRWRAEHDWKRHAVHFAAIRRLLTERPKLELTEEREKPRLTKDYQRAMELAEAHFRLHCPTGNTWLARTLREISAMFATTDAGEADDAQS